MAFIIGCMLGIGILIAIVPLIELFGFVGGVVLWFLLVWLGNVVCRAAYRYVCGEDWGASPYR